LFWNQLSSNDNRRHLMKKITRHTALTIMALTAAALCFNAHAKGPFPERTVTLVVPFGPGGPTDALARIVAEGMSRHLGQTVVVENVSGAGGTLGSARVARAQPDGYTILIGNTGTLAGSQGLFKTLPFNTLVDFVPIASVGDAPQVLVARKDFPAKTIEEMISYVKGQGKAINIATAGVGSGSFLGALVVNAGVGANMTTINYRSTGQATTDLMTGQVDLLVDSSTTAVQHVKRGSIQAIAVLQEQPVEQLPQTKGVKNPALQYRIWNMIVAPKGIDQSVVARLNQSIRSTLENPTVAARLSSVGVAIPAAEQLTPEGARTMLHAEVKRWAPLAKSAGLTLD
jgi:tripartite-type tricarboxylate transporter receptor subunit TctC